MDRRQLLLGMSALALARTALGSLPLNAQASISAFTSKDLLNRVSSDREQAGLRGPVRTVIEGDHETEFDSQGHTLHWHFKMNDGSEYGNDYTYDASGHLQKISSRQYDHSSREQLYSYDEAGRLLTITESDGTSTQFEYEQNKLRRKIRTVHPTPPQPGIAESSALAGEFGVFDELDFGPYLPGGGAVTTIYDEQGRPSEIQLHHADGALCMRATRTYDAQGRVRDEEAVRENLAPLFLASFSDQERAKITSEPGSLEQLSKAMSEFNKMLGPNRVRYVYDQNGRMIQTSRDTMYMAITKRVTYNQQGDVIEEHQSYARNSKMPVGVSFSTDENGNFVPEKPRAEWPPQPDLPPPMVTRYSYVYDSFGNWTERTITYAGASAGVTVQRTLTYF